MEKAPGEKTGGAFFIPGLMIPGVQAPAGGLTFLSLNKKVSKALS